MCTLFSGIYLVFMKLLEEFCLSVGRFLLLSFTLLLFYFTIFHYLLFAVELSCLRNFSYVCYNGFLLVCCFIDCSINMRLMTSTYHAWNLYLYGFQRQVHFLLPFSFLTLNRSIKGRTRGPPLPIIVLKKNGRPYLDALGAVILMPPLGGWGV